MVWFASGIGVGIILALAVRKAQHIRALRKNAPEKRHFIDGARGATAAELAAHPTEEAHMTSPHLMSEASDVAPDTQRW